MEFLAWAIDKASLQSLIETTSFLRELSEDGHSSIERWKLTSRASHTASRHTTPALRRQRLMIMTWWMNFVHWIPHPLQSSSSLQSPLSSATCIFCVTRRGRRVGAKPAALLDTARWTCPGMQAPAARSHWVEFSSKWGSEPGRVPGLVRSPGRYTIWGGTSLVAACAGYKQGSDSSSSLAVVSDRTSSATKHRSGRPERFIITQLDRRS